MAVDTKSVQNGPQHWNDDTVFNLKALTACDNDKIYHGRMEFDMGEIVEPRYGSGHFKGSIPLLLSKGDYNQPTQESQEKAFQFLVQWAEKHGLEYDTRKYRDEKFRLAIAVMAHSVESDISEPINLSLVSILLTAYYLDDIQTETGFFSQFDNTADSDEEIAYGFQLADDVMNGKYKDIKTLPELDYPIFKPLVLLLFLRYELSIGLSFKLSSARADAEESASAFIALTDDEILNTCSERTYLSFRGKDTGFIPAIETVGVGQGLKISDRIRRNVLFGRMREAYTCAMSLLNDLLGIRNELKDENPVNLVLMKVKKYGLSLEEAVEQVSQLIKSELNDMVICSEKLMDKYPGHSDLIRYIHNLKYSWDGQAALYGNKANFSRYGVTKSNMIYD